MELSWLPAILQEAEAIPLDDLVEPEFESEEGDAIIGQVTDSFLQRLYSLAQTKHHRSHAMGESDASLNGHASLGDYIGEAEKLHDDYDLIMRIFWHSIKRVFVIPPGHMMGIRKGWQVVSRKQEVPRVEVLVMDLGQGLLYL